ncbi:hypothetical protein [Helcococcus kunzii]|uniref:hypothetical protein n=1 Tax=Helcococcus kunzii TaxID=40091 RepID=UPI0024AE0C07|nr:hypothetical protein [Helcococcus kunzii]
MNTFNLYMQEEERGASVEDIKESFNEKDISEFNSLLVIGELVDGGTYIAYCVDNAYKAIGLMEKLKSDMLNGEEDQFD